MNINRNMDSGVAVNIHNINIDSDVDRAIDMDIAKDIKIHINIHININTYRSTHINLNCLILNSNSFINS